MRYVLRRLGFYLVAAWASITLNFFIPRLMPGDPVQVLFAQLQGKMDPRSMDAVYEAFGFVQGPLYLQYFTYLRNLLQGNMGISVAYFPVPVLEVLGTGFIWTLYLVGVATLISFGLGTLLGIVTAWKRGGWLDSILPPLMMLFNAFPYFWLSMLVLYTFAIGLEWFPRGHAYNDNISPGWNLTFVGSVLYHTILPASTMVITALGGWLLGMRNNMIGTLSEDYITLAQAKGLSDRRVMFTYAARNALLPSITGLAMSIGFVISGALLTEIVFGYPGLGYILLLAVNRRDYPLIQSQLLMVTFAVLLANLIADIVYTRLDPRVRVG
jgi:peptide/nickel transport system permease protein